MDRTFWVADPDAEPGRVPEIVVQRIWQEVRFDVSRLRTTAGDPVRLYHPGRLNTGQGPDFLDARVQIGEVSWFGAVEIHRTSGEWLAHRHDRDRLYNNVVLHVVLTGDLHTGQLRREDGTLLPEVVLLPVLDDALRRLAHRFASPVPNELPCHPLWSGTPEELRLGLLDQQAGRRLQDRAGRLAERFVRVPDLDQLLYEQVFRALGYAKNSDPMQDLARRLPLAGLARFDTSLEVEAALFGVAGLLPAPSRIESPDTRAYVERLYAVFDRIRYSLPVPMPAETWQFFRLRPSNFPTRRIAQAAVLAGPSGLLRHDPVGQLVHAIDERRPLRALREAFAADAGLFWRQHVRLDRPLKRPQSATLGRARIDRMLLDAALPLVLLHAEQINEPALADRIRATVHQMPARHDEITRRFEAAGTRPVSASQSQGMHHLYRTRCSAGGCLTCPIALESMR